MEITRLSIGRSIGRSGGRKRDFHRQLNVINHHIFIGRSDCGTVGDCLVHDYMITGGSWCLGQRCSWTFWWSTGWWSYQLWWLQDKCCFFCLIVGNIFNFLLLFVVESDIPSLGKIADIFEDLWRRSTAFNYSWWSICGWFKNCRRLSCCSKKLIYFDYLNSHQTRKRTAAGFGLYKKMVQLSNIPDPELEDEPPPRTLPELCPP